MVEQRALGKSGFTTPPLVLGGNTFGWTADRDATFAILDAFYAGGGRMVDTADVYWAFSPGNTGGESETLIGEWIQARRAPRRDRRDQDRGRARRIAGPRPGADRARGGERAAPAADRRDRSLLRPFPRSQDAGRGDRSARSTGWSKPARSRRSAPRTTRAEQLREALDASRKTGWSNIRCSSRITAWCSAASMKARCAISAATRALAYRLFCARARAS